MAKVKIFNPETMVKPRSTYSHVAEIDAGARLVFLAGQIAIDHSGNPLGANDFETQCAEVFANIGKALNAAHADWKNVVQFMAFLVRREDIPKYAAFRQREFPKYFPDGIYPPSTLLIVNGLAHEAFLIEVQAVAAV
jgi:enamine deaminase RidA (YjgF/YER057c/UK114 family)